MNAKSWLDYIGGMVTVRVKGPYPEKVINLALSRGIYLMGVNRRGEDISFSLRTSGLEPLRSIVDNLEYGMDVESKQGWPFLKRILQRRWALALGGILFVVALYVLSSFIWYLGVVGSRHVAPEMILQSAARYGLYDGVNKMGLDTKAVEDGILKDIPRLSYVEVDIKGIRGTIKVVEKILPDDLVIKGPAHVVARKGGIIEDFFVLTGEAQVEKGQIVGKGQILISGVIKPPPEQISPEPEEPKLVKAEGSVRARVWYEGYGEYPLEQEVWVPTGRSKWGVSLSTPWGTFGSKRQASGFTRARCQKKAWVIDSPWGKLGFTRTSWNEIQVKTKHYSEKEAVEKAKEVALNNLKRALKNTERVYDTRVRVVSAPSDSLIRIKASAEVLEDIGVQQPMSLDLTEHPQAQDWVGQDDSAFAPDAARDAY
ncbi:MAG: sporulation protein YqfD [Acidobacteriota bacterium]